MSRSLFLLKRREDYSSDPSYSYSNQISTGMWNSAVFVKDTLEAGQQEADVKMVVDANSIDAEVSLYDPDFVFIEGLWVTPAKIAELLAIPRHQSRTWVIRIHSEIPFLASEGTAFDWMGQYLDLGIVVAPNAPRAHQQVARFAVTKGMSPTQIEQQVVYLPNPYPEAVTSLEPPLGLTTTGSTLEVGCFGAFRPLKNHLQQLFIAERFATSIGRTLRFHINGRVDAGGGGALRNVISAAVGLGVEVVGHEWEDRVTFLQSLRSIDLLLQVSMSETFNIVAADATLVGRPMLVSNEIPWAASPFADPQSVEKSVKVLESVWANRPMFVQNNQRGLRRYHLESARRWLLYVE